MITCEEVRDNFDYDPKTGDFFKIRRTKKYGEVKTLCKNISKSGYYRTSYKGKTYFVHRLIWIYKTGNHPELNILHCNGDKLDNRWRNLFEGDNTQRWIEYNQKIRIDNKSGYRNVLFDSTRQKWYVLFVINGEKHFWGYYKDLEEAASVSIKERERLYKEARIWI